MRRPEGEPEIAHQTVRDRGGGGIPLGRARRQQRHIEGRGFQGRAQQLQHAAGAAQAALEQLALDALASVQIAPPAIRTSPSENGRLYVQVPTWLWLDSTWWQTYEATANTGRVWSTVRATPVATTWELGDGRSVSCRGPGTPWRRGLSEDASSCTHTYRSSSASRPGGTFSLEATVTLEVSWTSNAAAGGTLPAITRSSTLAVEVGEIQAIGTRGGG